MTAEQPLDERNRQLAEISQTLYGGSMRLMLADPRDLVLLKKNARVFKKDTFRQLVANISRDKRLSSVPLCHALGNGKLEVLSGNHRVGAAIEAGLPLIMVLVILQDLTRSEQIAIQLSHNAIVGEDDPTILSELWAEIDDIAAKLYAGLSSDIVEQLEKVELVSFTTPQVATRNMTFVFTEEDAAKLNAVIDALEMIPAKEAFLVPLQNFERFYELLEQTKIKCNVRNSSLAMLHMTSMVEQTLAAMPATQTGQEASS